MLAKRTVICEDLVPRRLKLRCKPKRKFIVSGRCLAQEDDIAYFQSKVDEMWDHWLVPGVIPFRKQLEEDRPPA